MSRRSCYMALFFVMLVATIAEAKPRKYSWEISPFVAMKDYDSGLGIGTHGAPGIRLGYNLTRHWEVEASFSYDADVDNRFSTADTDVEQLDLNVVLNLNTKQDTHQKKGRWISGDRWVPYLTAGVSHFSIDTDVGHSDGMQLNFGGGTRLMVSDIVGVRFDVRTLVSTDDDEFVDSFTNFEASLGASFIVGGGVPRDSDSDGVVDGVDKCPGTPLGCWVDELGCPRDSDGDGVCDGLDRCPNTPAGCPVDQHGCPLDEDGDGVCDGLDDCPGTPMGAWVDDRGCPRDSDGDGVYDGIDRCPDTLAGCEVDAQGCPLDEDGDGVCDGLDQCPGTPPRTRVDEVGCPVEVIKLVLANVHFQFNKSDIQPFYMAVLDEVAESLLANDWRRVEIELRGHTDNIDSVEYNYRLGQARADTVKEYLVAKGVSPARLITKSFSELEPTASNDTEEGRALNRRVEMVPTSMVEAERTAPVRILVRDLLFGNNSAELSAEGMAYLDEIAAAFGGEQFEDLSFMVTGHGGSRIGAERASAVASYLASRGIDSGRIMTSGEGKGDRKAVVLPKSN